MDPTISQQLQKAIDDSGMTRYAISKATGVDQSSLSRFMSGKQMLSLEAVDLICQHLGLKLSQRRDRRENDS